MSKRYFRQNLVAGLVVMAVGAAAFLLTFGMPGNAPIFPRVASTLLFLLGGILALLNGFAMWGRTDDDLKPVAFADFINPLYSLIIMIGYAAAITLAGFYVATILMMIIYMLHLGVRSIKTVVGVTALVVVLVYLVFSLQLEVPLPKGFLI